MKDLFGTVFVHSQIIVGSVKIKRKKKKVQEKRLETFSLRFQHKNEKREERWHGETHEIALAHKLM